MSTSLRMIDGDSSRPAGLPAVPLAPRAARLGEELPIFCEKCGYLLHGAVQIRCSECDILHFRCPECGHTQAINTLRPAFQKILGRLRAFALALWVFFKINFFFWLLFAWGAMGYEWTYTATWIQSTTAVPQVMPPNMPGRAPTRAVVNTPIFRLRDIDEEAVFVFCIFAAPFAVFSRLLLLRWRRGVLVGLGLSGLVSLACMLGALLRQYELTHWYGPSSARQLLEVPTPFGYELFVMLLLTSVCITLFAVLAWPLWLMCVRLLLPQRIGTSLLDWQSGLSEKASSLVRE